DLAIQRVNHEIAGSASAVQLTGIYHNLERKWADAYQRTAAHPRPHSTAQYDKRRDARWHRPKELSCRAKELSSRAKPKDLLSRVHGTVETSGRGGRRAEARGRSSVPHPFCGLCRKGRVSTQAHIIRRP